MPHATQLLLELQLISEMQFWCARAAADDPHHMDSSRALAREFQRRGAAVSLAERILRGIE